MRVLTFILAVVVAIAPLALGGSAYAGGGGGAKKPSKSPAKRSVTTLTSWIDVEPFTVSVIQGDAIAGTFMLTFGIDVPDGVLRERAQAILPRLRNNWLIAVNRYASTQLRPRAQADIGLIAAKLQKVTDETLGQPGAKVLLSQAIVLIK
ncbi:MAG TPA: hypothetical protein DCL54_13435 [Alphaproteobacteria bacterium]|nr:hypothetical protein [Alphaproteobacteria bacterium]HAJ47571.1 hypothetical protein [Alphaproteobacteria bacterium]